MIAKKLPDLDPSMFTNFEKGIQDCDELVFETSLPRNEMKYNDENAIDVFVINEYSIQKTKNQIVYGKEEKNS